MEYLREVELLGKKITVKGDLPPEKFDELLKYLNTKISELEKVTKAMSREALFLLLSLNLAEELVKAKERVKKCITLIDQHLQMPSEVA